MMTTIARSTGRRWPIALLLGLLALAALISTPPPRALAQQTATLTATVNADRSVDLTLSNGPGNWWFRINSGTCTAVSGTSVNGIQGYQSGTYTVRAYSDSNCGAQITWADFMILTAALTATVNADRSVDLTLSGHTGNWWFRIGWGSCAAVTGTTVSGISGYQTGTYSVAAYSGGGCTGLIGAANFIIPDPPAPTASLATTVNPGPSVDLTLTNGPNNWWFRINWWGSCTAVSGTSVNNIQGYKAGTHPVTAYSDSACNTEIASSSFIIPALALAVAVDSADWSVDLMLSGGPSNWWFRIGWWGNCAAASGTGVSNIRGYQSGSHLVAVYPAAGCEMGTHIAAESFTIPSATLTAAPDSDRSVDLTLKDGPSNWWFRINWWGGCTAAPGTTVSNIQGYQSGSHSVSAYSDSGCKYHVASTSFTLTDENLKASSVTSESATLTVGNHIGDWWYKATSGGGPHVSCSSQALSGAATTLTGLTGSTAYTYTAYTDSACTTSHGTATFTTLAPVAPDALSAPTLTTGNALLDATWTAPSSDGGSALTDYDLQYSSDGETTWNRALISPATYSPGSLGTKRSNPSSGEGLDLGNVSLTGLTVTKVTTGGISNVYKISEAVGAFRLRLVVQAGQAGQTVTYRARYASTAPTTSNLLTHGTQLWSASAYWKATATGDAWTLALPANTHFWITTTATSNLNPYSDVVTPTIQVDTVTVPATLAARLGGLTNGTTYAVQVRAVNAVGLGAWSPSGTLKAGLPARATAPTLVSGNTQLAATWAAVSGNGSNITDYDLRYSSDGGSTWTPVEMDAAANTARSYNITGLTNGTSYVVQVRATNTHGDGLWSPSSASVEVGAPDAPTAPNLTPAASQVTVTWTAPANSGSAITDYDLQYCSADCATTGVWTFVEMNAAANTALSFTITSLTDNTAYQVQVRATNARGDSGWSPATTLSTLSVGEIADTSAKLTLARGSHTGNWYLKRTAPTTGTCSGGTGISGTTHNLSSLTRNTAQTHTAYSDSSCTTVIALITFTTLPSSLTASASYTTATLTIGNHTGPWYVKQASPTVGSCSAAISGTTHSLTSLTDGVRYRFDAYSDAGCGTQIARGGTFDTTLYAPTGFSHTITTGLYGTASASWSRNSNTTGSVGYRLERYNGATWIHWKTVDPTTNTSLNHSNSSIGVDDIRVRAFRTTGGVTIYSSDGHPDGWVY